MGVQLIITIITISLLSLLQRWLGGPLRGGGGLRAGGWGRNHHEAAVGDGQVLRRLLPEAATGHQHQEPLVRRVLAVPLPVPPARTPAGEQELQESLHRWVTGSPAYLITWLGEWWGFSLLLCSRVTYKFIEHEKADEFCDANVFASLFPPFFALKRWPW